MQTWILIAFVVILNCYEFKSQNANDTIKFKKTSYLSDNKLQSALDSIIEKTVSDFMLSPQNSGLSIGIIKDSTTFFYNYGETELDNKTLPTKNTLYEIGAITKTFCGLLLACAVSENKIKLEDDIRLYLPNKYANLELNKQFIQLKNLANHTSGLPSLPDNIASQINYEPLNPYKNYNKQLLFDFLKTVQLNNEPGQICEYSNLGMALLGIILENIYEKTFEELVQEKICISNSMQTTLVNLTSAQQAILASGYNSNGQKTPHWGLGAFVAAGGLKSSSNDLINYLRYNINESDSATRLAHQITFNYGSTIGLGWQIITTKFNQQLIWHNGATYGFSSFCAFIKKQKVGVVILSNSANSVDYIGLSILKFFQTK